MNKFKKVALLLIVSVLSIFILSGCGNEGESTTSDKNVVKIAYPNWVEGIAMTHLSKVILEDKMGYEVDIDMADIGVIFTSLADGETDFLLDSWLPVLHKNYMEKYEDDLVDVGVNYDEGIVGIAVPEYVEANSIEELQEYKDDFNGEIIGIDAGANIMNTTDEGIKEYGLDYELIRGSEPVMVASLSDAIDNEESIAVIGWKPHWKFAEWDLKFLEDPKNVYGDAEKIHTIGRKDVAKDLPEVTEFFENFHFEDEEISDLILRLEDAEDKEEECRLWIEENEELVNSWIPEK